MKNQSHQDLRSLSGSHHETEQPQSIPIINDNGVAIAGFVCAVFVLPFAWIPIIGWVVSPVWFCGVVFSLIGFYRALFKTKKHAKLAFAGLLISLVGTFVWFAGLRAFDNVEEDIATNTSDSTTSTAHDAENLSAQPPTSEPTVSTPTTTTATAPTTTTTTINPPTTTTAPTTTNSPERPSAPKLIARNGAIGVVWVPPHDNGSPITGYELRYRPAVEGLLPYITFPESETDGWILGIPNDTTYYVKIRAKNDDGFSVWSAEASATPTKNK